MTKTSSRRSSAWLLGATVVAATGLLTGCGLGNPQPDYPETENFRSQKTIFDASISLDDAHSINFMVDAPSDRATFDASLWDQATQAYTEDDSLELERGQTGEILGLTITLCEIWHTNESYGHLLGPPETWVYYAYAVDGTTPVCPKRLN